MNFKSPQKQRGIALLAVLAVSVALSLLITSATVMMQRQLSIGETAQQQFLEKAAAYKKEQELIYLLATQRLTRAGISKGENQEGTAREDGRFTSLFTGDEIRVDGFEYIEEVSGVPITFSIQAADGLIPINTPNQFWLKRWLKSYGIDDFTIAKLADHLADYADEDDWARPAGAEVFIYQQEGVPAPTNFLFQTCSELYNVLLWKQAIAQFNIDINKCSVFRSATLNLNAAPIELLASMLSENNANNAINSSDSSFTKAVTREWFITTNDATNIFPQLVTINEDLYAQIGDATFRVEVSTQYHTAKNYVERGNNLAPPITRGR